MVGLKPKTVFKDNLLFDSLAVWGPEFDIHVDIKINSWIASWGSIIRFEAKDGGCCEIGQRFPAIWTKAGTSDRLMIATQINGNGNKALAEAEVFDTNIWYKFIISQKKERVSKTWIKSYFML